MKNVLLSSMNRHINICSSYVATKKSFCNQEELPRKACHQGGDTGPFKLCLAFNP